MTPPCSEQLKLCGRRVQASEVRASSAGFAGV